MFEPFTDIRYLDEKVHLDDRGAFLKCFDREIVHPQGFSVEQVNFVETHREGVFRGLHYQAGDKAEAKIFRVVAGSIQLVCFDTRVDSASFGETGSLILSEPAKAVLVPRGYATGYLTLAADTSVLYMADAPYCPEAERGVSVLDPALRITLEIPDPLLSEKDANWPPWPTG